MLKKVFLFVSLFFTVFFLLVGCVQTTTTTGDPNIALPDLTGMSREQITASLENLDLTVKYYFDLSSTFDSDSDYDKFVMYGSDLVAGDMVLKGSEVKVYTTPLTLNVHYVYDLDPSLQLQDSDYLNKEFIADGIGEVSVNKFVDGDTTWFNSNGFSFSVRYLGIDTPESTALYEAWGKAAAHFTQDVLSSAEKIVLQAEGDRQDGNGRYLAWVWYLPSGSDQFLLLNLQLVELAYSKNKVSTGSLYTDVLSLASWDASLTKRRVWGELDPGFDYSKEGAQMSIQYLMENFNDFVGLKVVVTGQITRIESNNIFLQDESGYGINMYIGYATSAQLQLGVHITVGGLIPGYYNGAPQISNFNKVNLSLSTETYEIVPQIVTYSDFNFFLMGSLVTIEHLTVVSVSGSTIIVRDSSLHQFSIRSNGIDVSSLGITAGSIVTVTGPLSYYDYNYNNDPSTYVYDMANCQLMLTDSVDIVIE
ncbi:MAG: thermonuclease family protein [Candidatus Izemoplasmatales bacterium]|nr:thermonuclease family protein [Candidatus Izemoplasmatales bacterium]